MRFRSALAVLAILASAMVLSGCRNGLFRRDPVYYCQPVQCQPAMAAPCQPVVCCPQ